MPRGTPGGRPAAPTPYNVNTLQYQHLTMLQHLTMPEDHQEFNKAKDEAALNTGPGEIQLGGTSANAKEKPISAALLDDEAMVKIMPVSG